jgi:predicted nucleotidyltransferase
MLGLHRPDSDIDITVYGEAAGRDVYQTLQDMLDQTDGPLRRPNRAELAALHAEHRSDTPLSFDEFARLQIRKVNELRFRGREVFVRFVKLPHEIEECYGDRRFDLLRPTAVRARVTDDRDAMFTPSRYVVEDAVFLAGGPAPHLREIVSLRGRFSDQVRAGEWAVAVGRLEQVVRGDASLYHRLMVGGQAGDYLLAGSVPKKDDV